jgi:hypothetical protein
VRKCMEEIENVGKKNKVNVFFSVFSS